MVKHTQTIRRQKKILAAFHVYCVTLIIDYNEILASNFPEHILMTTCFKIKRIFCLSPKTIFSLHNFQQ